VGKVALIAFGSNDELIGGLKSKKVQGLVVPDPVKIGYETVLALHKHLKGEKLPKRINLGKSVLTPENLSEPRIQQLLKPQQLQN
jgi:ribose transport system substrate-binding protein